MKVQVRMRMRVRVRVGDFDVDSYFSWGSLTDFLVDL
jgi:hypothetical protein